MAPLSDVKLRILAFPQRISGRSLDVNVLLMPTQRLLYDQAAFPSVLNAGASVQLPAFINADLGLEVVAIRGLASYPFSNPASLSGGETLRVVSDQCRDAGRFAGALRRAPVAVQGRADAARRWRPGSDVDAIRKYLPVSYRSAFNFTQPANRVCQDGRQLSLRDQTIVGNPTRPSSSRATPSPGAASSRSASVSRAWRSASACCIAST